MSLRGIATSTLPLLLVVEIAFANFAEDTCKETGVKVTANVAVSGDDKTKIPVSFDCKAWQGDYTKQWYHVITKCYTGAMPWSYIEPPKSGKISQGRLSSKTTYCMTCDNSKPPKLVLMEKSTDKSCE